MAQKTMHNPTRIATSAHLLQRARILGASDAVLMTAGFIVVQDHFAAMCAAPTRCASYGLAPGCPPHAITPGQFREQLEQYQLALVFKIDVSIAALMGPDRLSIARTIHLIAATLEQEALNLGWSRARGLAAGSCRELFCAEMEVCRVLAHKLPCPYMALARPSLSALGIDFARLAHTAGWEFGKITAQPEKEDRTMGLMAGLVLLAGPLDQEALSPIISTTIGQPDAQGGGQNADKDQ